MAEQSTTQRVHLCLERIRAGEARARDELLETACGRLRKLTSRMLGADPRVHRFEQTGDVLQAAAMRLWRALAEVTPESPRAFFQFASALIRRELLDLARRHYGPRGVGRILADGGPAGRNAEPDSVADDRADPVRAAMWAEFHERVERLPAAEREVVDLLWYQGLIQAEAAEVLQADRHTVRRRWIAARLKLADLMRDVLPVAEE